MATPFDPVLLIHRNGEFKSRIEGYLELAGESSPVTPVSIIGVQSTGKSTLLNHVFGTSFPVMDESQGMARTTQGIWVAKCPSPRGGSQILVIDTEGSDGAERGDDVKFEKQTALFSLAISNTVIMNMKCDNVNLYQGAGQPLLRTVFEVMIQKFCTPRKVNLIFVLRDKNQVTLPKLKEKLMTRLLKLWEDMTKPQGQVDASLEDYFRIEVVAMPHFQYDKEKFIAEVASLRELIMECTTSDELAKERVAASDFAVLAKNMWNAIKEDKALDLPEQRIMVAEVRCNAIAEEKYRSFCEDQSWIRIKKDVESSEIVQGFGNEVSSICVMYLNMYDTDTQYYDETKRNAGKDRLITKLLRDNIEPTYCRLVGHVIHATLQSFQEAAVRNEIVKNNGFNETKTKLIKEFQNQLKDARIRLPNWNWESKLITYLESEMNFIIQRVRNEVLELRKKGRQIFWERTLPIIGAGLLGAGAGVAAMIMAPGVGTFAGASVLSTSTTATIAALANQNLRPRKDLESAVAAKLKDAQRSEHVHGLEQILFKVQDYPRLRKRASHS